MWVKLRKSNRRAQTQRTRRSEEGLCVSISSTFIYNIEKDKRRRNWEYFAWIKKPFFRSVTNDVSKRVCLFLPVATSNSEGGQTLKRKQPLSWIFGNHTIKDRMWAGFRVVNCPARWYLYCPLDICIDHLGYISQPKSQHIRDLANYCKYLRYS